MADITSIIEYYVNLLIIQYHNLPKAQATIRALITEALANGIALDVMNGYDIETAIGHQLDILGKYADIDRFYIGQIFDGYFAFTEYTEVSIPATKRGFSDYADYLTKDGKFLLYDEILSTTLALSDDEFRTLLKLRIIQNNSNHSRKSIDDSIFNFFGDTLIPDSVGNMVMDYFASNSNLAIIMVAMQKGVLPKPMGVRLRYLIEFNAPFYGFSTYDGYSSRITGFSTYADYDTKVGESLTYSKLVEE